jgi:dihydroflavonol-4-reductase
LSLKILVTGGTGFLGSYILRRLIEKGHTVRAIRRRNKVPAHIPKNIIEKVEWVEGDVLDVVALEDAMEGIDAVIHAAGLVSFMKKDRREMYKVNVDGTANVVNMALEKKVSRFIHISSVAALGRTMHGGEVDEEKKWEDSKANSHYAKSKYKAELEVWRGFSEGLKGVILNPSTTLGYGDWTSGSSAIFRTVYNEFKWYSPGVNGFVDVEDVAEAVLLVLESTINEERFILNAENWPFKKLQDAIASTFRKKGPVWLTTPFFLALAWRLEKLKSVFSGKRPLLTRESALLAQSKTYFGNDKIRKAFPGFSFKPLEQTIKNSCERYLGTVNAMQP